MPDVYICLLQGIVQGLTEFLPVSSSGHLALLEQFFGMEPRLYLAAVLHLGTLGAVFVHYRKDIRYVISESFSFLFIVARRKQRLNVAWKENQGARTGISIVAASFPTALLGIAISRIWQVFAESLLLVSIGLLFTAGMLFVIRFFAGGKKKEITLMFALFIGVAQGLAAFPGISRSGTTIAAALLLGINRKEAARFSFLISIPAILGAVLFEADTLVMIESAHIPGVVLGTVTAGMVGYLALRLLLRWLESGKLHLFYYYVLPLGLGGFLWSLLM